MTSKGLKRKFPAEREESGPAWEYQRQSVLDISIEKFQRDLTLVEPSLRRSVLIANTLRQIQSEELMCANDALSTSEIPVKTPPAPIQNSVLQSNLSHHGCLQSFPAVTVCHPLTDNGDSWMSTSPEEEFSLSTAISSILKELDVEGSQDSSQPSLCPQRTPLGSIENLPGGLDAGSRHRSWMAGQRGEECDRRLEGGPLGSMAATYSSYLHSVGLDSLFLEEDMSVFDREVGSLGARTFSTVATEELARYLPSLAGSTATALTSPSMKDLHELDHIMEILVES